ncbi:cephalosporin-C deacetylase-like acetyl esterase [Cryobacterium sp. CAN_C3]|uniref:acetylxylan esterase n=1 Tax=unclassified Cryobacterium TaxID=2649013 RepID=UPI001A2247B4|nr:cephalosporin-C deacetylase-like acetyl esterase [Cryobacterium sp. CAN_C3]
MPRFYLSIPELRDYHPQVAEPADFDEFWRSTLAEARLFPTEPRLNSPLTQVEVYDLVFPGFGGQPVDAWYLLPAGTTGPLPAVVEDNGYGGGLGPPRAADLGPRQLTPICSWTPVATAASRAPAATPPTRTEPGRPYPDS